MATASQFGTPQGNVVSFRKRKPIEIEPELKAFLDDVVIPALVREALADLEREKKIELNGQVVEHCAHEVESAGMEVTR